MHNEGLPAEKRMAKEIRAHPTPTLTDACPNLSGTAEKARKPYPEHGASGLVAWAAVEMMYCSRVSIPVSMMPVATRRIFVLFAPSSRTGLPYLSVHS
ncbi:MAG: hypothetical protein ACYC7J_14300 [Syntrophales bacterium]